MAINGYVTFGQIHTHSIGGKTFDKDCVAIIQAEHKLLLQRKAEEIFGSQWSRVFPEDGWDHDKHMQFYPRGYMSLVPEVKDKSPNSYLELKEKL